MAAPMAAPPHDLVISPPAAPPIAAPPAWPRQTSGLDEHDASSRNGMIRLNVVTSFMVVLRLVMFCGTGWVRIVGGLSRGMSRVRHG